MDTHKIHFKAWFNKTINDQLEIRQELIGQSIAEIFYTPKVEGWDINIKDETIIHLPLGYLTIVTSLGHIYEINTNYQSFCGGLFGIMLAKKLTKETHSLAAFPLTNYILLDKKWSDISKFKLSQIDWNWNEPTFNPNQHVLIKSKAQKYIFEDCFLPESFVFHFDNGQKVYFFSFEPDAEIKDNQTYKLLSCGEEIMIFFDETKLLDWDIKTTGFQILVD
jgi:hypothetical protein